MPLAIYTEQDNGNLKLQAEIEEDMEDSEAVEALLEEVPRLKADRFVVLTGSLEDGTMSVVEQQEEVVTTTTWKSTRNGNGAVAAPKKRRGRPPKQAEPDDVEDDDGEEEAPAPKRRGRPPGSGRKAGKARGAAATKKAPARRGRPPGSKNKTSTRRSGFKRNTASDE